MHRFTKKPEIGTHPETGHPTFGFVIDDVFVTDPYASECGRFTADPARDYGLTPEDAKALAALNEGLREATEAAVNAGCKAIQDALGVTSGDVASRYFSSDASTKAVAQTLADYAEHELAVSAD